MSGIFRRQTTKRGGHGRRLLDCPVVVEVKWKGSGSACVLAPSVTGRLLRAWQGRSLRPCAFEDAAEHRYSKHLMHDCHASNHSSAFKTEEGAPCCYQSDTQVETCGEDRVVDGFASNKGTDICPRFASATTDDMLILHCEELLSRNPQWYSSSMCYVGTTTCYVVYVWC
jgi:hypothetical protein